MTGAGLARLGRIALSGITGLADLDLELGQVTALVGPRGSGKSQLLASIAWLITGRPHGLWTQWRPTAFALGEITAGGHTTTIQRRPGTRLRVDGAPDPALPTCSYLRARDRIGRPGSSTGHVARRLSEVVTNRTTDALAAEAIVSIVEACCTECVSGELLLIEEPELMLTPQAQRYLYQLLRRFSADGNQVVYSTRSSAFVDAAHHDEIVRLDLRAGRGSVHRTSPRVLTEAERVRLAGEFDHERSEMFFARAVVLVEGQTERLALPFLFRAMGHDPDAEGISIVEVGGKSNLPLAARLLRQLQIPFVVLFDADRGQASERLDQVIASAAGGAATMRLVPDFEAVAGIAGRDEKVLHAWRRFERAPARDIPPALRAVVDAAVALVGDF